MSVWKVRTCCSVCKTSLASLSGCSRDVLRAKQVVRWRSSLKQEEEKRKGSLDTLMYIVGTAVLAVGVTYASVPLYRRFCQATGLGGTTQLAKDTDKIGDMKKVENRLIRVQFNADIHSGMRWQFKPQQTDIWVHPGETALAFYTATNPTNKPIVGISTYNIIPFEAGQYFAKIQCFCFEEQILNPGEQVDMPVFFYIDPDFVEDPKMEFVDQLVLSYTFFEAKDGLNLPSPWDTEKTHEIARQHQALPQ